MQTAPRASLCVDRARARRVAGYLLASLPGVGATGVALADAGATDAGADVGAGAPYNLAEVVVTSRRREETLQDVPLAETVRTGAELEQQSAVLFEDAVQGVPNTLAFKSARSVSALEVTIRGRRRSHPRSSTTRRSAYISMGSMSPTAREPWAHCWMCPRSKSCAARRGRCSGAITPAARS